MSSARSSGSFGLIDLCYVRERAVVPSTPPVLSAHVHGNEVDTIGIVGLFSEVGA